MKISEKKALIQLTSEERKFIKKYRKLREAEKKKILKMIEGKRQADHTD